MNFYKTLLVFMNVYVSLIIHQLEVGLTVIF